MARKSIYDLRMEVDKEEEDKKLNRKSTTTNKSSNVKSTNNNTSTARKSAFELRREVDGLSDFDKKMKDKAKDKAKENKYNSYLQASDYRKYADMGNDMDNPSYNQADGSISIFGWQPFAKDVKNKVTYSRENSALLAMDDNNGVGDPKYKFMTNDEVGIYNYLLAKDGEKMADKYLESIDRILNERSTKGYAETSKQMASDNKVVGTALNLGTSFLTPAAYAKTVGQSIKNKVTGSNDIVDTYSGAFGPVAIEQATREGLEKNANGVGKFAIDTLLSMGQFATKLPLGNVGSLALMGTGAAGQTAKDIVDRGGNQKQALWGSTAAGAAEVVFEKISLDQLKAFKNMPATSVSALVKNILKGSFVEGSEEIGTDIANAITDKLIMGDSSQMDISYQNYKKQGMSDAQAKKHVAIDFAKQLGLSFASGAISGGLFSTGANIYGGYVNNKVGNKVANMQQEVIDEGLKSQPTTSSYQLATELQQQLDSGKKINNMALGQQYINNIQAINEEEAQQELEQQNELQYQQQPLQQNETPQINNLLQNQRVQQETPLVSNVNRQTTPLSTNTQTPIAQTIQTQVQNNGQANIQNNTQAQNNAQGSNLATEQINSTNPINSTIQTQNPQIKANTNVREPITKASATFTNNDTPITVKGINSTNNGSVILTVDNGDSTTVANLDDVTFSNENTAKVYSLASNYTSDGAKAFVSGYNGSLDLSTYVKAFNQYYNGGKTNLPIEKINNLSVFSKFIPDSIKQQAYFAGQNYSDTEVEARQQKASTIKNTQKQGGIQNADALDKISHEESILINYISKVANVSVVVDDDIEGANGYYKDGEIHISANAENKPLVVYSHELTHYMEDTSPKLWKNYKDYVINYMKSEHSEEYNKLTEHIKDLYRLNNLEITDDAIMNEIVANATEEFLTDANSIETLVKENRSLAEKILDVLSQFIEVIKSKFSDYAPTSTEGKMLRSNVEVLNNARKLWLKALNDSASVGTVSNEKVASLKETKFSLKDSEGNTLTKEQQEFFKDSKIRTRFGALIPVYHANVKNSNENFTSFKSNKSNYGQLIFFASNPIFSINWGGNVKNLDTNGQYGELTDKDGNIVNLVDEAMKNNGIVKGYTQGNLYVTYLNITKPFETFKNKQEKESLQNYLIDENFYDEEDAIQFTNNILENIEEPDLIEWLKTQSYDGIITQEDGSINYGAFYPEQIKAISNKKPTTNDDIRFSLKDTSDIDIERLTEENKKLQEANELLKEQFKLTKGYVPNEKALSKVANSIIKDYSSTYDRNTLTSNLKSLYEYISNSETMSWDEVMEATVGMAKSIVESSSKLNDTLYNQYADLRQKLRTTNITLSDAVKSELAYHYDSSENFRKKNFGRINLKNNGIALDELWGELSTEYPELFNVDTNALEQPLKLVEALDMIKPYYENPYGMNMDAISYDLALDIYNQYFTTPGIQTFADKKSKELRNVRNKYLNYIDSMREDYKTRYEARLKKMKQQQIEQIQKLSEKFKTASEEDKVRYRQMYNNLMDRKNDQLLNQRARFQEQRIRSNRSRKERAEIKKYRTRIEKNVKDLTTWVSHPTDAKHVPEVLKQTVLEFLTSLDMTSARLNAKGELTKKTLKWQDTMDNLRRMLQEMEKVTNENDTGGTLQDFYMDIDPNLVEKLDAFVGGNKQYESINSMGEKQLREIDYLVSVVKKAVTEANKMKANLRYQSIVELGNASMQELSNMRYRKAHNDIINKLDKFINLEQMDSFSYFESLGETATTIQQELRNGQDKHTLNIHQTIEYMKLLKGKTNTNKWTGKDAAIKTFDIDGKEVKITVAQIMELYELSKRKQALGHIYGGGIKIQEVVGKENKKNERIRHIKPITLTEETLHTIIDSLTDEQKRIADGMQEFMSNQASSWGNETHLEMYGYKKFTEPNYYPIKSDDNYTLTQDQNSATGQLYAIKNLGMTKETKEHANNPLIVGDIFDTFTRHINEMSTYNAFLIPLSDAMKWYNYKQRVETEKDGKVVKVVNGTIKEGIERVWNNPGKTYFVELIKAINGVSSTSSSADILANMIANAKIASVGASLSTVIQQPTAYVRAMYMVDMKYLVMGLAKKPHVEKAKTYSPIVRWKSWGFFDINIGRSMKSIITGERTTVENLREKSLWLASQADNVTLGTLWNAIEFETKSKHKDLKFGSEEFNKVVGERLSEVIDRTQVVDTILHRSQMMRSKDTLVKMSTSFMSEPNKSYNMMRSALVKAIDDKSADSKKNLARAIMAVVSSGILAGAAKALVDAFRDNEKDKDGKEKKYVDKYYDYFKSDAWDNLNPLNFLPITREIVSLQKGFTPQRMDMTAFTNMYYAVNEVLKFSQGESKKSNYAIFSQVSRALSQMFGVPFGNVLREVESIYNNVSADGIDMKSETSSAERTYLTMYQALMNDDSAKYDKLLKFLVEHNKKTDAIDSGLRNVLVDNEPLITEAGQARLSGNIARYKAIVNELKSKGFKQDVVITAINSYLNSLKPKTEKEKKPAKLYKYDDLFTAINKNNINTMTEIRDYFVDNGTSLKTIQSQITKKYKDTYIGYYNNGDTTGMAEMEDTLISYFGYEEDTLNEWKGITTTNMAQSLIDGDLDKVDEILNNKLDGLSGDEYDDKLNSFKSTITKKIKPTYIEYYENGDTDKMDELKSLLIDYFGYQDETIDKWLEVEE